MLQWTTPAMLVGLGLLSLPIIAHLLNKKSNDRYFIPTVQFLIASSAQQNRFLKLRKWLLLLLRCLAMAGIVCAFARPVWWQGRTAVGNTDARAMVIVLDRSLSTTQKVGNSSLFQSMRGAAIRSLDELETGRDRASVILVGDVPEPLSRKVVPNLPELKTRLRQVQPTFERADISTAIAEASRQLNLFDGHRLLVVISDMQRSNWEPVLAQISQSPQSKLPPNTKVRFVQLKERVTENVGLSNAHCDPPDPTRGQQCTLTVSATNYSDQQKQIPVNLFSADQKIGTQNLMIEPRKSIVASFQVKFSDNSSFRFSIPRDNLSVDDQTFVAVAPGALTPITLLSDDAQNAIGSSKFFLERAVRPFDNESDRYQIQHLDMRSFQQGVLTGQDILIVGYVARWTDAAIDELLNFVKTGGRLVYLCGEGNVAGQVARIEKRAGTACFPFRPTQLDRMINFDDMLQVTVGKWRSRWLRAFDFSSQVALQQIRFDKVWNVGPTRTGAEVLLRYSDDRPALGHSAFGEGTIVLANLSPSVEFSEFGKFGSFAALMQIIVGQLRDDESTEKTITVGAAVNFKPEKTSSTGGTETRKPFSVLGPGGQTLESLQAKTEDAITCVVPRAAKPGLYQLRTGNEVLQTVAVTTDVRESQLEYLQPIDVEAPWGETATATIEPRAFGLDLIDSGNPLWSWLAAAAVLMLTCESFLLGWWKR